MEFILFLNLFLSVLFQTGYFIQLTEHNVRVMESSSAFFQYLSKISLHLRTHYKMGSSELFIPLFFTWRCGQTRAIASSFTSLVDHTQRRTTFGRTPLDK
jgi:hypothetical protein